MADITIIMPSYNKEKYIAEALDSVFMQETVYDYHIIIADDCSTDKTIDIVKEYQQKYPNKITLLTSNVNQKLYRNVLRAYEITKTDYFCVLDPDDYWIDKHKIQKALDYLENNKEYTIYVTDTLMLMPNGEKKILVKRDNVIDTSFNDFLNGKAALGCTLGSTFRNIVFKNGIPEKMKTLECETMVNSFRGDTFRSLVHLYYGKAHCVPDQDAVYRVTEDGLWQGMNEFNRYLAHTISFKDLWLYFDKKYPELLIISHNAYNKKIKVDLLDKLLEADKIEKKNDIIKKIKDLENTYNTYQEVIEQHLYKNATFKYKIILSLYKKLQKKLLKKDLI